MRLFFSFSIHQSAGILVARKLTHFFATRSHLNLTPPPFNTCSYAMHAPHYKDPGPAVCNAHADLDFAILPFSGPCALLLLLLRSRGPSILPPPFPISSHLIWHTALYIASYLALIFIYFTRLSSIKRLAEY